MSVDNGRRKQLLHIYHNVKILWCYCFLSQAFKRVNVVFMNMFERDSKIVYLKNKNNENSENGKMIQWRENTKVVLFRSS